MGFYDETKSLKRLARHKRAAVRKTKGQPYGNHVPWMLDDGTVGTMHVTKGRFNPDKKQA